MAETILRTRVLTKVKPDTGKTLTFDLAESEDGVWLEARLNEVLIQGSVNLIEIEPGKPGAFQNAPAGMAYAFWTKDRKPFCLNQDDGESLKSARDEALRRIHERSDAQLDPELRDALKRYPPRLGQPSSARAHAAEDVRAYDILSAAGF